jgi:hypothetical protein
VTSTSTLRHAHQYVAPFDLAATSPYGFAVATSA